MPSSQTPKRDEYIAGLRRLADWLEQNPDLPAGGAQRVLLPLTTNPAVEEFASVHGLTVKVDEDGNASADIEFGPIVYHAYGYADFAEWCKRQDERRARQWADRNGMVIESREEAAR